MKVRELQERTGASLRALRYYESCGLVVPRRLPNGYRDYDPVAVRQVEQIRTLTSFGLSVEQTRPFVDCLALGHAEADDCPSSMAAYRGAIDGLTRHIEALTRCRDQLSQHLDVAAARVMPGWPARTSRASIESTGPDGTASAQRVLGRGLPALCLPATDGSSVDLTSLPNRTILFVYPLTGRPALDMPDGWATIPGAIGCTAEVCGFRDLHRELLVAGAGAVLGLSSQTTVYQTELSNRLGLAFPLLSDPWLTLAAGLGLPTFEVDGMRLYTRATLVVDAGVVTHVWSPIPDPAHHPSDVVEWLRRC